VDRSLVEDSHGKVNMVRWHPTSSEVSAGLLLLHRPTDVTADDWQAFDRVVASFPRRITRGVCRRLGSRRTILAVWSHDLSRSGGLLQDERTGDWIALVGNPARADLRNVDGDSLLRILLGEFQEKGADFVSSLSPPFALALGEGASGAVRVVVDRCGLQHLYVADQDRVWVSSSSLALSSVVTAAVDRAAVAEWVSVGHFLSNRTFIQGVSKLSGGERLLLPPGPDATISSNDVPDAAPNDSPTYCDAFLASLETSGRDEGLSNELTGGLDSRLVLAGLLHAGTRSLSWTFGDPGCRDIRTAHELVRLADFPYLVVPIEASFADDLSNLVREMHEVSDGEVSALEYAPLLIAFDGLRERRVTSLSGAGGEMARGYYYDVRARGGPTVRGIPLDGLLTQVTRFSKGLGAALRQDFFRDPLEPAAHVLEELIRQSVYTTPAAILDDVYLRSRMQRFAGRNFTTTGLFCRQGLPYFGNDLLAVVAGLPESDKVDSAAMRQLLAQLSPPLAAAPLASGASPPAFPPTVPWNAARRHRGFGAFARDLLCSGSSAVGEFFEPDRVHSLVDSSLAEGSLAPLGLLITLELTLGRLRAARQPARSGSAPPMAIDGLPAGH
jgi:hypothetical protein